MLSADLRSLCGTFRRRVAAFDGQIFMDSHQAANVIGLLETLADQAERLEQHVVPASARDIPDGVIDLSAERRRRAQAPAGGDAA